MNEEIVLLIFALVYSAVSSLLNILVERKKEVIKLAKEIEKYKKKNDMEKLFEAYIKLNRITLKYVILNLIVGLIFFSILYYILKDLSIQIPYFGWSLSWIIVYMVLVFVLSMTIRAFYKGLQKIINKLLL